MFTLKAYRHKYKLCKFLVLLQKCDITVGMALWNLKDDKVKKQYFSSNSHMAKHSICPFLTQRSSETEPGPKPTVSVQVFPSLLQLLDLVWYPQKTVNTKNGFSTMSHETGK